MVLRQCCSCHATQQDGVLPGRSNRQQSSAGPGNMRRNMRRLQPLVGAVKVNFGWKLGPFILASVNHNPARNKRATIQHWFSYDKFLNATTCSSR